ncbi:MAG: hypothetical protein IJ744_03970 [Lachnospiraceae bacterium]|nr:hypothetical protein [Lachnospiraceae bacterium]
MYDIIKKLYDENKMACIHTDANDLNRFIYGKIIGLDSKNFVVSLVSPNGKADGILVKELEDIIWVEISTKYDDKMNKLMANENNGMESKFITEHLLQECLLQCKENGSICSIELDHSGYSNIIGIIVEVKEETCSLKQLDEYGEEEGICFISISDISQVCINSSDEVRISKLYAFNSSIQQRGK